MDKRDHEPFLSVRSGPNFPVATYNWFLPDDHYIYSEHKRLLKNSSVSTLMATLQNAQVYEGLSKEEHTVSFRKDPSPSCGASSVMRHTTPSEQKFYETEDPLFQARVYIRSEHCE